MISSAMTNLSKQITNLIDCSISTSRHLFYKVTFLLIFTTSVEFQVLRTRGVAHHLLDMCLSASKGSPAKVPTPASTVRGSSSLRPVISV